MNGVIDSVAFHSASLRCDNPYTILSIDDCIIRQGAAVRIENIDAVEPTPDNCIISHNEVTTIPERYTGIFLFNDAILYRSVSDVDAEYPLSVCVGVSPRQEAVSYHEVSCRIPDEDTEEVSPNLVALNNIGVTLNTISGPSLFCKVQVGCDVDWLVEFVG